MKTTKMVFSFPTPCLYVGSMVEYHGEGLVSGPYMTRFNHLAYQIKFPNGEALTCPNRDSFVVNDCPQS